MIIIINVIGLDVSLQIIFQAHKIWTDTVNHVHTHTDIDHVIRHTVGPLARWIPSLNS